MIVWTGRGIVSVGILAIMILLGLWIFPKGTEDYAFVIALFVTAAFSWFLWDKWNNEDPRVVIDQKTGQKINLKSVHALFWIKMEYWGIIFSVFGIIILAQNSIIASIISAVIFLGIAIFIYLSKRNRSGIAITSKAETKKDKFQVNKGVVEQFSQVETEEERIKRRLEKEDPSRFMPK